MVTNRELLDIVSKGYRPQVITSATRLRRYAEQKVAKRVLTWEEWLDVRDAWTKANNAFLFQQPNCSLMSLQQAIERALVEKNEYILLENV